jgi:hypothetical protein
MKRVAGFEHAVRLALSATMIVGCGGAMTVQGEIVQPAQVPVRAFPRILVSAAPNPESRDLAARVARHLSRGRSAVEQLEPDAIRALREGGRIERATVVIELQATLTRQDQSHWGLRSRPLDCGPLGCFDPRGGSSMQDIPMLRADLLLRVLDGPSGDTLQEVELSEQETGGDALAMRLRVLDRLADGALALVDQRVERVAVHLYPIDRPEVRRALAAVREGSWSEARRHLELFAHSRHFRSLPRDQRALVLYDLGQARRFDTTVTAEERFAGASRALRAAVRLAPQPLYARAIAALESHRRSRYMVREQQEAMAHNFALSAGAMADTPQPPPQYRN